MVKLNFKRIISILLITLMIFVTNINNKKEIVAIDSLNEGELRAVWITPVSGDIKAYTSEANFKEEMNNILDMLEYYNINAIMFHIRTHNNALYKSSLNPKSSVWANVNFEVFDPLEWLITETKNRGMEFHAWLNPYRLGTGYVGTMPSINPASNSSNTLRNPDNQALYILNPGLPEVREFITLTVKEIIENYDVDAIHFDDYFYTNLGTNGSNIIEEGDQDTFLMYQGTYPNTNAGKADWRREQVNLMIESVSSVIKDHNALNNKYVQFGISPTGIYKNGNGVVTYDNAGKAVTSGSNTRGQTHYSSYLFSDSLYWVNEGYLDYLLPQSYWATNHPVASYYEVMGWWNKVFENLDVNLYSGIGLYQAIESSNYYDWKTNPLEASKQFDFLNTLNNVSGSSIFTLNTVDKAYRNTSPLLNSLMNNLKNNHFNKIVPLPELKSMSKVNLEGVTGFNNLNGILTWDKMAEAKSYYIYRSSNELMFSNEEIIGVVGQNINSFNTNDLSDEYNYGIRALSKTNTLGEKTTLNSKVETLLYTSLREKSVDVEEALVFYGSISEDINYDKIGFYLVYGETTLNELRNKLNVNDFSINNKEVFKKYVNNITEENIFSVNLTNIPITGYGYKISAVAFYVLNGNITLSSNITVSSPAIAAINYKNADINNEYANKIMNNLINNYERKGINSFGVMETLNNFYESNLKELEKEFVKDWNNKFNLEFTNIEATSFYNSARTGLTGALNQNFGISESNIYKFFNDPNYKTKWGWFLNFLESVDGTVHTSRQINAIKNDGTLEPYALYCAIHLSHSIANFFNKEHLVGGYTAINFTNEELYNTLLDFNNVIFINPHLYEIIYIK